jgi:flagellar biogenesis protein FliO
VWGLRDYLSAQGRASDLIFSLGSFAVAIGLVLYERYFLKKLKRVSYL